MEPGNEYVNRASRRKIDAFHTAFHFFPLRWCFIHTYNIGCTHMYNEKWTFQVQIQPTSTEPFFLVSLVNPATWYRL